MKGWIIKKLDDAKAQMELRFRRMNWAADAMLWSIRIPHSTFRPEVHVVSEADWTPMEADWAAQFLSIQV